MSFILETDCPARFLGPLKTGEDMWRGSEEKERYLTFDITHVPMRVCQRSTCQTGRAPLLQNGHHVFVPGAKALGTDLRISHRLPHILHDVRSWNMTRANVAAQRASDLNIQRKHQHLLPGFLLELNRKAPEMQDPPGELAGHR